VVELLFIVAPHQLVTRELLRKNMTKQTCHCFLQQDEIGNLKAQLREQTRHIADLKQSLMVSDLIRASTTTKCGQTLNKSP